jgi:hypothetical protein
MFSRDRDIESTGIVTNAVDIICINSRIILYSSMNVTFKYDRFDRFVVLC